jgi:hypothetical protein
VKFSLITGSILTGLALILAGCDTAETKSESKPEVPVVNPGPAAPEPPVVPSPTPSLPPTGKSEEKPPETKAPETKTEEAKPEVKKEEPKLETPK